MADQSAAPAVVIIDGIRYIPESAAAPSRPAGERPDDLLSVEELDTRYGITFSRPHRWKMAREGKFPKPVKLGGNTTRYLRGEIEAYLAARKAAR